MNLESLTDLQTKVDWFIQKTYDLRHEELAAVRNIGRFHASASRAI